MRESVGIAQADLQSVKDERGNGDGGRIPVSILHPCMEYSLLHAGGELRGYGLAANNGAARGICQIRDGSPSFEVCVLAALQPAASV